MSNEKNNNNHNMKLEQFDNINWLKIILSNHIFDSVTIFSGNIALWVEQTFLISPFFFVVFLTNMLLLVK